MFLPLTSFRLGEFTLRWRWLLLLTFDFHFGMLRAPDWDAARLLLRFGIRLPDPFPQPFQHIGAGLWAEPLIGAESLHDGLNDLLLNPIRAGFPFPVIEHFGEATDNRTVAVTVFVFKAKEFS